VGGPSVGYTQPRKEHHACDLHSVAADLFMHLAGSELIGMSMAVAMS
jgi:hypothetical protein